MNARVSLPLPSLARLASSLLFVLMCSTAALAQDADRLAPGPPHETRLELGQLPPSTFSLESTEGEVHDLAAARGERPLVLLFFRGTW